MAEVLPNIYRITFYNLPEEMGYEFKFAANGNWNANWGRGDNTEMVLNTPFDASFNAKNFIFDLEEDSNVTITLDLTGFDFATKSGAKVTIDVGRASGHYADICCCGHAKPYRLQLVGLAGYRSCA